MTLQIFRYLRGQWFQRGDVTEGTYGRRNRQLVPFGIRASNSSAELTEIILSKRLYQFLYAVNNQQNLTVGFLSPYTQYWRWFLYQGDNSDHVFLVSTSTLLPHIYIISKNKSYKNIVLYPVCICKLRHFVINKTLKGFMKVIGHSLFYSQLRLPSKPDSSLSSENPFSTPGDKINFCVFEAHHWLFNCGLQSPSADRMTRHCL